MKNLFCCPLLIKHLNISTHISSFSGHSSMLEALKHFHCFAKLLKTLQINVCFLERQQVVARCGSFTIFDIVECHEIHYYKNHTARRCVKEQSKALSAEIHLNNKISWFGMRPVSGKRALQRIGKMNCSLFIHFHTRCSSGQGRFWGSNPRIDFINTIWTRSPAGHI